MIISIIVGIVLIIALTLYSCARVSSKISRWEEIKDDYVNYLLNDTEKPIDEESDGQPLT